MPASANGVATSTQHCITKATDMLLCGTVASILSPGMGLPEKCFYTMWRMDGSSFALVMLKVKGRRASRELEEKLQGQGRTPTYVFWAPNGSGPIYMY